MDTKKQFSVLVSEDEYPARNLLISYVDSHPDLKLAGIARTGEETLEKLKENRYDLVLLDIHLPDISGIEVLERLDSYPYVIFTTSYDQYAVKAFELGAVDYLLKPISKERFKSAIERFIKFWEKRINLENLNRLALSFKERKNYYLIPYQDIVYLSSHGKHTVIHANEQDLESSKMMKYFSEKLSDNFFLRIHKQYIININYISQVNIDRTGQYSVIMSDNDEVNLPVGRHYLSGLKDKVDIGQG